MDTPLAQWTHHVEVFCGLTSFLISANPLGNIRTLVPHSKLGDHCGGLKSRSPHCPLNSAPSGSSLTQVQQNAKIVIRIHVSFAEVKKQDKHMWSSAVRPLSISDLNLNMLNAVVPLFSPNLPGYPHALRYFLQQTLVSPSPSSWTPVYLHRWFSQPPRVPRGA